MTDTVRLAKRLAEQIACSRQEAEQYIAGGWVKVDGVVIEEAGYRIAPEQSIELVPNATLTPAAPVTFLINKAAGARIDTIASTLNINSQAAGDRSGIAFLKRHLNNLTLCGDLTSEASGLVILTQDWRVARKLIDDAAKIEHEFIVEVSGTMQANGLQLLNQGITLNGKVLPAMKVSWQNETRLRFALKAPQSHLIEQMCASVGLSVLAQKRIRIGRLAMSSLALGEWRYLLGYERF